MNIFAEGDNILASKFNENFNKAYNTNFSDSTDGDVLISTSVSLSRDMYYGVLTIANGGVLNCNGFKIYALKTDIQSGGKIEMKGGNATDASGYTPGSGGAAAYYGNLLSAPAGLDGGYGAYGDTNREDGKSGVNKSHSIGNDGASGGDSGDAAGSAGIGGSASLPQIPITSFKKAVDFYTYADGVLTQYQGNAGSGSGGGSFEHNDDGCGGGGSGSSGGFAYLVSREIILNGSISLDGGNGGKGADGENIVGSPSA